MLGYVRSYIYIIIIIIMYEIPPIILDAVEYKTCMPSGSCYEGGSN